MTRIKKMTFWIVTVFFYICLFLLYWIFLTADTALYVGKLVSQMGIESTQSFVIFYFIVGTILTIAFCFLNVWAYRKKRVFFWLLFILHAYYLYKLYSIVADPNPIRII